MKYISLGRASRGITHLLLTLSAVMAFVGRAAIAGAQSNNPVISSVTLSASNLILSGSGGLSGLTYYVVASTNMALSPLSLWDKIATNTFAADGTFTNNILIDLSLSQEFFVIDMLLPPPDTDSPTTPGNLTATGVNSNQINLGWAAAVDNVGVTAYLVERQELGGTNFTQIGSTSGTSYNDTSLLANTNYSYRVRATDAAANLSPYSSVAGAATLPLALVAYSFDEGTGGTVTNAAGNGNNGAISGATWTNVDVFGNALVFNGSNALVAINDSAPLHLTTGMTIEAWVNPSVVSNLWQDVIYKGNDNYFLEATSTHNKVPAGGATIGGADVVTFGNAALAVNTWAHLAATYDGTALRLYVNGVQVSTLPKAGNILASTNPLQIGGDTIFGQYFRGIIDEVRIYNVALTAAQIQSDMNLPVGNIPTAPGNLTATGVSSNQINLGWGAAVDSVGVTAYLVERQALDSTNFTQIGSTSGTSYCDTGLLANTNYSYRVRATNGAGHTGRYSNVAQAYTGLSINPRTVVLTVTQTQQFIADFGNANAIWSVDGVVGGSTPSGTITATGFYSPPNSVGTHLVAVSNPTQSATATVYVTDYPGMFTYHNDVFRTGQNLNETVLTPTNVNLATFGKLFRYALDGLTFASPLYVANVSIPSNGFHNVVFVATEHDSVYAFDADGLADGPLWQVSFLNPAAGVTTVPSADTGEIGDIPNEIGITGTPVIDPASGTLYVVAKTKEVSGNTTNYVQRLHALDIATAAEKFGGPVVIQGSVPGTGLGSVGGQVPFISLRENQRTALLLANGVVVFGFGSHGDRDPFYGWVMGYSATNLQNQTLIYNDAPNASKSGIWMSGDGLACDSTGNVYFITGNGTLTANTGGSDYGDCFVKISPAGAVLDYFSPGIQAVLDSGDLDLGSGGALLLPDQNGPHLHEMVSAGKNGTIYLVDRDNMGHYHTNGDQIVESVVNIFTNATGITGGSYCSPVYFNGNVYFSPVKDNVQAFQLSNGLLSTNPTSRTSVQYGGRGGTLAISANGNSNGILWALQSNGTTSPGVLHAYNAANLGNELYNSSQAGTRDTLDAWSKFTLPLVANGKVFITSVSQLTIYGLLP